MWDEGADGYARGEGFAAVVLKSLSQAVADGDNIECVIRETRVNQDGRTPGISMPNATSQANLIRSTYAKAGLDPSLMTERCQYFEAHGTGTLAGDPKEAEAICSVFFPKNTSEAARDDILFVGSIKTIIGHLEGTAGLAGLLKASLGVQHGFIPPNLLFNRLNPAIEPFYKNLRVPTALHPWPKLPEGQPRRASVNSFGFGGTNCHVIIESWEGDSAVDIDSTSLIPHYGPFILSANSQKSLMTTIISVAEKLKTTEDVDLASLASTLQNRRTEFRYRASFSAVSRDELRSKMDRLVDSEPVEFVTTALPVRKDLPPRLLGVFTGQGAQWPSMGASLFARCASFRSSIQVMEESLSSLSDGPAWSLSAELIASVESSRVHEAAISQPLCTALQIALVDLLKESGISFSAVVGHSSGEIAAAYAAGHIHTGDAIRIAYYRGKYAHLARNQGRSGKMIAVGMSYSQACDFCQEEMFRNRIVPAASNSRSSVTLSGDADAIDEAKKILDDRNTFARVLKVDTAYHSHHMEPCVSPYLESLQSCDIQVLAGAGCKWYSSVHGPDGRSLNILDGLADTYWVDNMAKPVLFSQAVDRAVLEEHCHDLVLELGPHPALKGPASEVLKAVTGVDLPYTGVLKRGEDDMNAFSDALGFIWAHFDSPVPIVNFDAFRTACLGNEVCQPSIMKNLPPYSWDHDKPLWKESRVSRDYRTREQPVHELLGSSICYGDNQEYLWRNVLKLSELPWLQGHQFQDQVLFPAAGYVSMAFEAALALVKGQPVQLVELQDLVIHQAITLEEESAGTEVVVSVRVTDRADDRINAQYSCYSRDIDGSSTHSDKANFTGSAVISLGHASPETLPSRVAQTLPMSSINIDRLYHSLLHIGLRYSGDFLVESAERRLNTSTVYVRRQECSQLRIHPATLDAAFHSLLLAFCYPGDGKLWTTYLPTRIQSVRISMPCPEASGSKHSRLIADGYVTSSSSKTLSGDVEIFCAEDSHPEIQVSGLTCSSFTKPRPQNDLNLFMQTIWKQDISAGVAPEAQPPYRPELIDRLEACERVCCYYLRRLRNEISEDEIPLMEWHFQSLMDWALNHVLPKSIADSSRQSKLNGRTIPEIQSLS
jgi:acyl transferase domain-containing protein